MRRTLPPRRTRPQTNQTIREIKVPVSDRAVKCSKMRSALLCVFLTLIIQGDTTRAQNDDFRPTPIPLNDWHHDRRVGRAGTLHESFKTDSPSPVASLPAHYWEDALRHSVYLTLVRDKIDQLIAKGNVISPNSKPDTYDSKEINDHDLWDKIKSASFDRIQEEDPGFFGDVAIVAKGRLLEEKENFRFVEDEKSKEKCSADDCMRGVKAFWSVKRVRQRDHETSPGKYHYELTFSVISQTPKKQRKPYENPIRTFTVKESSPNGIIDRPKEYQKYEQIQTARPERAVWFHKNIAPVKQTGRRQYFEGLDRIFSSFFSDNEEKTYEVVPPMFKQVVTQPTPLMPNLGHSGVFSNQHKQIGFAYRPQASKFVRPPLQAPPVNPMYQYSDMTLIPTSNRNPYAQYPYDHRVEPSQAVKTIRPAVLPTPLPPIFPSKDQYSEMTYTMSFEGIDNTTFAPEVGKIHKTNNKYKSTTAKVNYFSDHVRPPVHSAPPGVFVTMDKKPFKPLPPLNVLHSSKPHRTNKPIDFRPSPQLLDIQNTDSFSESAFKPITINFANSGTTEKLEPINSTKKEEHKMRKPTPNGKKPSKKHNTKLERVTTSAPDIITAKPSSEEIIETMDWTNVLGALTRTTPMISQKERIKVFETTTPMTTTSTIKTTTKKNIATTEAPQETTISSTAIPKKRTRPPPKFVKHDKIKKHKRLTSTTARTTTSVLENIIKIKSTPDLTPLATSAAIGSATKSYRELNNKTLQTTTTTTTTSSTTTTSTTTKPKPSRVTNTTSQPTITSKTVTKKPLTSTTHPKNENRFRQSTLMLKGTSIKHDRWSGLPKNQTTTTQSLTPLAYRRKGSNFQGHIYASTPIISDEENKDHSDSKTESSTLKTTELIQTTSSHSEETVEEIESNSVLPLEVSNENDEDKQIDEDYDDEAKDYSEFIFHPKLTSTNDKINDTKELNMPQASPQIMATPHTPAKNKTKCKKKKNNQSTTEATSIIELEAVDKSTKSFTTVAIEKTTKDPISTDDILQDFFNLNFNDDNENLTKKTVKDDLQKEESSNSESYLKFDDFEDFLDIQLTGNKDHSEYIPDNEQYENDDDDNGNEDEEYENRNDHDDAHFHLNHNVGNEETHQHSGKSNAKEERPISFLELMAMS